VVFALAVSASVFGRALGHTVISQAVKTKSFSLDYIFSLGCAGDAPTFVRQMGVVAESTFLLGKLGRPMSLAIVTIPSRFCSC